MAKNLNPKCKQCRRAGEKLFLKGERCSIAKCAIIKRNYPPGMHGAKKSRRKFTGFGEQLNEKQKVKRQYNLLEKQFRLIFEKAKRHTGNTGEIFIKLLETRFDNVIYRTGIASSRSQARQFINHGLFTINNQKMDIPSYHVKTGDIIKIKTNKKDVKIFKNLDEKLKNHEQANWIDFDLSQQTAKILHEPKLDGLKFNFNIQMVVEFYSR